MNLQEMTIRDIDAIGKDELLDVLDFLSKKTVGIVKIYVNQTIIFVNSLYKEVVDVESMVIETKPLIPEYFCYLEDLIVKYDFKILADYKKICMRNVAYMERVRKLT